jgi:hypothetical protein
MKTLAPETIRLIQCALDARDALRRLVATIDNAGTDAARQAEILQKAREVCLSHADLLRGALRDSAARRHGPRVAEQPLWTVGKEREA